MKKILFVVLTILFAVSCGKPSYKINGIISGDKETISEGEAYLFSNMESSVKDTAQMVNGKFTFEGTVEDPGQYFIAFKGIPKVRIPILLENAIYTVTADNDNLKNAKISGGESQMLINEVNDFSSKAAKAIKANSLMSEYYSEATSEDRKTEIENEFNSLNESISSYKDSVINANPMTYFALINLQQDLENKMDEASDMIAKFKASPKFQESSILKDIEKVYNTISKLQPGNQAPDFTENDTEGNPVKFSEVYPKNKITMIDFWASWCGPCRAFNPTLVKIYKKYSDKGFGIISVSMDSKNDSWIEAIKKDELTWTHVSDLNYWNSKVGQLYYVRFIPQNVFVDQTGKILARQLDSDKIDSFLEEHLK